MRQACYMLGCRPFLPSFQSSSGNGEKKYDRFRGRECSFSANLRSTRQITIGLEGRCDACLLVFRSRPEYRIFKGELTFRTQRAGRASCDAATPKAETQQVQGRIHALRILFKGQRLDP